jgi:hypothetical protein
MTHQPQSGWWVNAKVGDKVTPIVDDDLWYDLHGQRSNFDPVNGHVYTIIALRDEPRFESGVAIDIGIRSGVCVELYDPADFLPVQSKSTDTGMAVFRSILNGQRVPESV